MTLKIDVIIPSYNRATILKRAIDSVLAQTYPHFSLYVVNDGSTDETNDLIKNYQDIHYLEQENKGVSSARNYGIKNSHSEWIAFLDSDDEWLPNKLEAQVSFLEAHPEMSFVHSNEIWIRNGVRVNPKNKFDKSNNHIFKRSLEMCLISPSTTLIRRDLIVKHNLFDESLEICEDYDLWLKILATDEVGFIPENLVKKYGGHVDQLSLKYSVMDFWRIQSLINLLDLKDLGDTKRQLVRAEISKKAPVLEAGLLKHNHLDQLQKLREMLNRIKP